MRYKRVITALAALAIAPGLVVAASAAAAPPPKPYATAPGETVPVPVPPKPDPSRDHVAPPPDMTIVKGGHPVPRNGMELKSACSGVCYKYAGQAYTSTGITSASSNVRVAIPSVDQVDHHSLASMTFENGNDIVVVGWTRDRALFGETYPALNTHLIVEAYYNNGGVRTWCGWNGGCGYTDYGSNPINAGANVSAQNGVQKQMQIVYSAGNIWLWYDSNWLGYYPSSLGHSRSLTSATQVQTYGEVAAAHDPTCTDMGNSWLANGTNTYPTSGADFATLNIAKGGAYSLTDYTGSVLTDAAHWNLVDKGIGTLVYGGPGYSPNPGACP